jgi:pimeloyl-ACP methyl ester carboxylesterase
MFSADTTHSRGARRRTILTFALAVAAAAAGTVLACGAAKSTTQPPAAVRTVAIHYRTHDGADRLAYVLLPSDYRPGESPPLPLVISPHGRGATGHSNATFWGNLPAAGHFAVVNPDGMGRRLKRFSYGYRGQIDDLARMPDLLAKALPWLRIDRRRIYALGSSMGGQETLLLVARHPHLLAGAAAMDSVTDVGRRYRQLVQVPCDRKCLARWGEPRGANLQSVMRREVGGTPDQAPGAYAARSPLALAKRIASSGVPLQVWWSSEDRIVIDQAHQSGALFHELRRLNPCTPTTAYAGRWQHSTEMRSTSLLPLALVDFGLLRPGFLQRPRSIRYSAAPACATGA